LTLCGQTALAAQEVKALEDLNSSYYRDEEGRHLVPWELRVLAVRLQGMGFNDARRGVMGYYELAREARLTLTSLKKSRTLTLSLKGDGEGEEKVDVDVDVDDILEAKIKKWETRLQELGIKVASALVEMDDLEGAARFLSTLSPSSDSASLSSALESQKALLYLCLGDVEAARSCISARKEENEAKVILALAHMADSDFTSAVAIWNNLISSPESTELPMYRQNLGVCLLYLGRMSEVCHPAPLRLLHITLLTRHIYVGARNPRGISRRELLLPRTDLQPLDHLRALHRALAGFEDRTGGENRCASGKGW
jgi:hypothetical protein